MYVFLCVFERYGDPRDLHVLTHPFPTRRSSELAVPEARRARDGGAGMSGTGKGLLFDGSDWDFDLIRRVHEAVAEVAERTLKLDTYPNQIEVITAEQMQIGRAHV